MRPPKTQDLKNLQVFHGLRALSIVWVVWVHHYAYNDISVYCKLNCVRRLSFHVHYIVYSTKVVPKYYTAELTRQTRGNERKVKGGKGEGRGKPANTSPVLLFYLAFILRTVIVGALKKTRTEVTVVVPLTSMLCGRNVTDHLS